MQRIARRLLLTAALALLAPVVGHAQTVFSTFGPGDSYISNTYWSVEPNQSIAQGFVYGGSSGLLLSYLRLALPGVSNPYSVSFRNGASLNTASTMESWSVSALSDGIHTATSLLTPALVNGQTYWITAANTVSSGGWNFNDQGLFGLQYAFGPATGPWTDCPQCESAAVDVTVATPTTATPEPATLTLFATGLAAIAIPTIRRRRKAESA